MKNLMKTMARAVRKSVFGEPINQVDVEFVPSKDDQINNLLSRVKAFNRVPLYQPTVEDRKAEADTMRDLKKWISKLSDNDRAIVVGRKPWEIMNHMMGLVPIDGVVAFGRGASYDFSDAFSPTAANQNARRAAGAQPLSRWGEQRAPACQVGNQPGAQQDRKMEPAYTYEPPKPSAAFMAKFA